MHNAGAGAGAGHSISDSMGEIRKFMGNCFQHDVLYPELTVKEHLNLYAGLKGIAGAEAEARPAAQSAPHSLRRALLMPWVNAGSRYRCGKRT